MAAPIHTSVMRGCEMARKSALTASPSSNTS